MLSKLLHRLIGSHQIIKKKKQNSVFTDNNYGDKITYQQPDISLLLIKIYWQIGKKFSVGCILFMTDILDNSGFILFYLFFITSIILYQNLLL